MLRPNSNGPELEEPGAEKIRLADDVANTSHSTAPIGATVENHLDSTLWRLVSGDLELHDLTPALQAWYVAGYTAGAVVANRDEIQRLEWERNLWYYVASNPGKRPGDFYTHLTSELWREAAA